MPGQVNGRGAVAGDERRFSRWALALALAAPLAGMVVIASAGRADPAGLAAKAPGLSRLAEAAPVAEGARKTWLLAAVLRAPADR